MARNVLEVLREIIGGQTIEIARLQAELERLHEQVDAYASAPSVPPVMDTRK